MPTVPFALNFTGDIDPLAIATFVLALVTLAAVVIAARALRLARRNDEGWRAHIDNDQRPVVVPVHNAVQMPLYQGHGELLVPVENIGAGPALDLNVYVTPRADDGSVSAAWGEIKHTGTTAGLGTAKTTPVEVRALGLGSLTCFDVWVSYSDLAGGQWVTSAKYMASEEGSRYTNMWIAPVPDGQTPRAWLGFE